MFTVKSTAAPERAIRLKRQLMAFYSYCLLWAGTFIGVELAAFEPNTPTLALLALIVIINVFFYLLIRTGISKQFRDPSLTIVQMAAGILLTTAILHYSRELRGAMLSIYFMVMTFGVLALDRRRMLLIAAFTQLCFTSLLIYEWFEAPQQAIFSYLVGHWLILALGLGWFIYMGGYIHNLQSRVREQRRRLHEAHNRLSAIAVRDDLTGLYNRRHFLERLEEEMSRANRENNPLHLAIIDLDHFKQVNDTYGHHAGDDVLHRFALLAAMGLRKSDLLARYGGEEFVVLFPHTSTQACQAAMERLRNRFAQQHYSFSGDLRSKFSAGLTPYQPGESAEEFIKRADRALYQAKDLGRNRIQLAN